VLRKSFFTGEQVLAILHDYRNAGLEPEEVAVMSFAEKVTLNAHSVSPEDIQALRGHGLTDAEILDVVLTASARNFFSKALDGVGAEPDAAFRDLEADLREGLALGRPYEVSG